jgi:hypothetical protein
MADAVRQFWGQWFREGLWLVRSQSSQSSRASSNWWEIWIKGNYAIVYGKQGLPIVSILFLQHVAQLVAYLRNQLSARPYVRSCSQQNSPWPRKSPRNNEITFPKLTNTICGFCVPIHPWRCGCHIKPCCKATVYKCSMKYGRFPCLSPTTLMWPTNKLI